jgi:hypothetical protein
MRGRFLYVDNQEQWISKGRHIFKSSDQGLNWEKFYSIPCHFLVKLLFKITLLARLLRLDIHHFVKVDANNAICVFNKEIIWLDLYSKKIIQRDIVQGNRPLSFVRHNNDIVYGEYRGNSERSAVHVWKANISDKIWQPILKLTDVRHIHGVYTDPFSNEIWVTTGDENDEAKVIILNEQFVTDRILIQGNQQARIVQPIFTKKFIFFASDAPNEINFIYRYNRSAGKIEKLQEVNGPIYFGQMVAGMLFFSTVVEPSDVNSQSTVELWASLCGEAWQRVRVFDKDKLSLKYFQYGQIILPNKQLNDQFFCFSEFATKNHLKMHRLDVTELTNNTF